MKSLVLAVMGLLCCMSVSAEDFEVDGIYYNITSSTDKTVSVTYRGNYNDSYFNEYSGVIVVPETVTYSATTYTVTSIGESAFSPCSSLTSVVIPNTVISIGEYAFYGCSSLISLVVAADNPIYDSREGCNAIIESSSNTLIVGCLSTIIPNSVTSIGSSAFSGSSSLTSVDIPNSVTSIGAQAFWGCTSLASVKIPNSVISIGERAFFSCSGLTSVEIPNSVTSIASGVFEFCI